MEKYFNFISRNRNNKLCNILSLFLVFVRDPHLNSTPMKGGSNGNGKHLHRYQALS
jgi:hypothetical protein